SVWLVVQGDVEDGTVQAGGGKREALTQESPDSSGLIRVAQMVDGILRDAAVRRPLAKLVDGTIIRFCSTSRCTTLPAFSRSVSRTSSDWSCSLTLAPRRRSSRAWQSSSKMPKRRSFADELGKSMVRHKTGMNQSLTLG